jgi:predicted DNA-binding transcriptional regulator YafY
VQRIESAAMTERSFTPPATRVDHDGHFGFMPGKPFQVVVEAEARVAPYLRERIWSGDQKFAELEGGRLMLVFSATSENEVVSWVLGFAGEVKLMSPKNLRSQIGERAGNLAQQHG